MNCSSSPVRGWGPWTHDLIVKPNNDGHRGHIYTISVMKTGALTCGALNTYAAPL